MVHTLPQLVLKDVFKVYRVRQGWQDKLLRLTSPDYVAIADINLEIAANTFVSIIGPSGCGKSTLLNTCLWRSKKTLCGNTLS